MLKTESTFESFHMDEHINTIFANINHDKRVPQKDKEKDMNSSKFSYQGQIETILHSKFQDTKELDR